MITIRRSRWSNIDRTVNTSQQTPIRLRCHECIGLSIRLVRGVAYLTALLVQFNFMASEKKCGYWTGGSWYSIIQKGRQCPYRRLVYRMENLDKGKYFLSFIFRISRVLWEYPWHGGIDELCKARAKGTDGHVDDPRFEPSACQKYRVCTLTLKGIHTR